MVPLKKYSQVHESAMEPSILHDSPALAMSMHELCIASWQFHSSGKMRRCARRPQKPCWRFSGATWSWLADVVLLSPPTKSFQLALDRILYLWTRIWSSHIPLFKLCRLASKNVLGQWYLVYQVAVSSASVQAGAVLQAFGSYFSRQEKYIGLFLIFLWFCFLSLQP